ncbi:MAG: FemAB family PEP-CTERM system-associated protein [Sterolibacteriaceae bacterium]|nr:FemAB family PEP-CTERM system-associated protein [Candidatus Methylophosphatis haderslevensis]
MQISKCLIVPVPADEPRWDAYVRMSPDCSVYHLSGWQRVVRDCFGHDSYDIMSVSEDGVCNGILPLVHMKSRVFGNFFVSLPYFNYGGICADSPVIADKLWQKAVELASSKKGDYIELRSAQELPWSLPAKTNKVTMELNLPQAPEALWKSFSSKLRSQIKRPLREGMSFKLGGIDLLDSFYSVFADNMRSLGTPVYSRSFFRAILTEFPQSVRICAVFNTFGDPVAAGFLVGFRDRIEIPWASSLRSHNHLSPNMLLYWASLSFACEQGYKVFDFGRSTPGEGTFKFKQQWGAQPIQLYWYYWLRDGESLPNLNPKNPKYSLAISIWKKLPLAVTNWLGPIVVRNIP